MTAKRYLQQAKRLNARIDANLLEVERLRALATSISSVDLSREGVRTSGTPDRTGNVVAKIVDLEKEINAEIDGFVDLMREIRERIDAMDDDDLRLILKKRYLNFQKWERIAIDMDLTYQWVHRLHKRALADFEKKI
jgi:hypothetical protein